MRARCGGRIVNIASRAHLGKNKKSNYCAAKVGVLGLTAALSIGLGLDNITVNSVALGLIRTHRLKSTDISRTSIAMRSRARPSSVRACPRTSRRRLCT